MRCATVDEKRANAPAPRRTQASHGVTAEELAVRAAREREQAARVENAEWDHACQRLAELNSRLPRTRNGRSVRQLAVRKGQRVVLEVPGQRVQVSLVLLEQHAHGIVVSIGYSAAWPLPVVEDALVGTHGDAAADAPPPPAAPSAPEPAPTLPGASTSSWDELRLVALLARSVGLEALLKATENGAGWVGRLHQLAGVLEAMNRTPALRRRRKQRYAR